MYNPAYLKLPKDVHRKTVDIASSYRSLLNRRYDFDGMENQTRENERQIKAIEDAWQAARDDTERELISKNLFDGVQMKYINLPMSESTMKRVRGNFLKRLAKNLYLI